MKIDIYRGDICSAPAEVICTSTNPHLELMIGTGGAVRTMGGMAIQEECYAVIAEERKERGKGWLEPGRAVRTTAGQLRYRFVIQCVAIDAFHDSTPEIIRSCVQNALRLSAEAQPPVASLALPVFASGNGRYDFEKSLSFMLEELRAAASAGTAPEQVWIVVLDEWRFESARKMIAPIADAPAG